MMATDLSLHHNAERSDMQATMQPARLGATYSPLKQATSLRATSTVVDTHDACQ